MIAEEEGADGCLHFNGRALVPFVGQVVGYRGYLVIRQKIDKRTLYSASPCGLLTSAKSSNPIHSRRR